MRTDTRLAIRPVVLAAVTLWALAAPRPASADWPASGRAISSAPGAQLHASAAADGAGGAIVVWQDDRNPKVNIFAQHVLFTGALDPGWPTDGRSLLDDPFAMESAAAGQVAPLAVPDGAGGAIVAWVDLRSAATELDVFAQHVLATGEVDPAWPDNGTPLCVVPRTQSSLVMVADGAGGAIVAWVDSRAGLAEFDIFAQHVLASGVVDPEWPVNGLAVCDLPGNQSSPVLVADGSGGAIIAWHDAREGSSGVDVFAQHVLASGSADPAWPVNGRALCTAPGDQGRGAIASDGAGGAIVLWSDSRVVGTSHIFAQHVSVTGVVDPAWPADGLAVSGAGSPETRPVAVPDGSGGAVVAWQAVDVHLNIYAQHVMAAGVVDPAWPAGGRAISDSERTQSNAEIASDGAGGAVIVWQDSLRLVAQHVLASGAFDPAYPETGIAVSDVSSRQGDAALVATGGAGAIVAWTDNRGADPDIFAMQVQAIAALDAPPPTPGAISFARPRPNPARGAIRLRFSLPRGARVRLAIYDATGRRVRELTSGEQPGGEHELGWDLRDERGIAVRSGLYFARLEVDGDVRTQKLVALE